MADKIPTDIIELLEEAVEEKIENFEIENQGGNAVGEGYMGDILFLTLKNRNTGKQHHVVVKQVLRSSSKSAMDFMSDSYLNEINFYTKVIPIYVDFQTSYPQSQRFDNIPKCLATSAERGREKLVLENLKFGNYEMHPKKIPLPDQMYEEIFKVYGRYHGLSLAFKIHQEEKFWELANSFSNNFKKMIDHGIMDKAVIGACYTLKMYLDTIDEKEMSKKMEKYITNGPQMFLDALAYKSPFSVILHGDCWSNNYMFKFNDSKKIEDVKLLDFQMVNCGSPILDLTYSFYSGAAKATLDKLDHFLHIYYNSVKDTLKQYDCDIEKVFSFEDLKKEWKEHHAFGYLMGLVLLMNKNADVSEEAYLPDLFDCKVDEKISYEYDNEAFRKHGTDLIRHMYENDFL